MSDWSYQSIVSWTKKTKSNFWPFGIHRKAWPITVGACSWGGAQQVRASSAASCAPSSVRWYSRRSASRLRAASTASANRGSCRIARGTAEIHSAPADGDRVLVLSILLGQRCRSPDIQLTHRLHRHPLEAFPLRRQCLLELLLVPHAVAMTSASSWTSRASRASSLARRFSSSARAVASGPGSGCDSRMYMVSLALSCIKIGRAQG